MAMVMVMMTVVVLTTGYTVLTTAAVALSLQYNISSIVGSLKERSRRSIIQVMGSSWVCASFCYFALAATCSSFFGMAIANIVPHPHHSSP